MHEFGIIARYFAPLATHKAALGLKDDAALLRVPAGQELAITTDAISAGVHFIGDEPPDLIARKLLRVNLSDLAAMGAKPLGYFLTLSLPAATDEPWLAAFAQGLRADQKEYGLSLLGGDTTHTQGPLTLSATMLGTLPRGRALKRSGAKPGDDIYVTGTIGDGALGLQVAKDSGFRIQDSKSTPPESRILNPESYLLSRYHLPQPRLALSQKLRGLATACMDISDGLMQDLGHICAASQAGAEIQWNWIPLSPAARAISRSPIPDSTFRETILTGGDDYELLFTAPPRAARKLATLARATHISITRIGSMTKGKLAIALDEKGEEIALPRKGYQHF